MIPSKRRRRRHLYNALPVRVSKADMDTLDAAAKAHGMTRTEYVRARLLLPSGRATAGGDDKEAACAS